MEERGKMAFFKDENIDCNEIISLLKYHPYRVNTIYGIKNNPFFDKTSGYMLDLKKGDPKMIKDLHKNLKSVLGTGFAISIVPSHIEKSCNDNSPLSIVAKKLVKSNNLIDATNCLIRTKKIDKLSNGGNRSCSVHYNSICVKYPSIISNKSVLLLDDITTTGNSLNACKQLLLEAGASEVCMLAVAKTVNDREKANEYFFEQKMRLR